MLNYIVYLLQKPSRRKKALPKSVKDEARLQRWQRAMTLDFMSSEESANDSDEENENFTIKPIPWRLEKLNDFFRNKLDPITSNKKGKRMRQPRVDGSPTNRPAPVRRYRDCLWTLHRSVHPTTQQPAP